MYEPLNCKNLHQINSVSKKDPVMMMSKILQKQQTWQLLLQ